MDRSELDRTVDAGVAPESSASLYQRHRRWVYGLLRLWVHEHHAAEDLTQDTFFRFFQRFPRPPYPDSTRGYLYQVARSRMLEWAGRRQPMPSAMLDLLAPRAALATEKSAAAERAMQTLQALTPEQREVIVLRVFHEMTFKDMAELLAQPLTTLHSRYTAGMQELQRKLRK